MKRLALFICTLLCANVLLAQTEFIVGNLKYQVHYSNPQEVVVYAADTTITTANIPETVTYQGTTYNVTYIGGGAFEGCRSLTSVDIPNSVTFIGEQSFRYCSSLTSITIPNSVTSVGCCVFSYCTNLTSITIGTGVTELLGGGDVYSEGGITRVGFFSYCSSLTSVTIPNSVTYIGKCAFKGCSSLTSVTIPNSVTSIGWWAFEGCSSLTSVDIPNSVTSIGDDAFEGCSSLTSVSLDMSSIPANLFPQSTALQNLALGENVVSIGSGAFSSSSFLQNVTCLATNPPTLADNTVFPYPNIATLTVPCGSLEAYSSATSFWNVFFSGRISENGYNVEVSVNDETFGSVAVESDCSTGTLTATANEGYRFVIWNDGNTDNPRVVSLSSDTAFTAIFALIDESSLLEAEAESISFFPNPTNSKVTFNQAIERIELMDLAGKTLRTFRNESEINIEQLPAGVYYLRLTNNEKQTLRKLIKE